MSASSRIPTCGNCSCGRIRAIGVLALASLLTAPSADAGVFVDGQPVSATLSCAVDPDTGFCTPGNLSIDVNQAVALGLRLLQVQNPAGPLSNEMPICVGNAGNCN